jgi:hypothetical protein
LVNTSFDDVEPDATGLFALSIELVLLVLRCPVAASKLDLREDGGLIPSTSGMERKIASYNET